jgi:uncharacterized damage-inducible protein DinB
MASSREIDQLLGVMDRAYDRKSWHGTNLRGSIRRVPVEAAAWRPAPGHHNIWELVVHAAYWKYAVRRRLLGEKRGSFALDGSNRRAERAKKILANQPRATVERDIKGRALDWFARPEPGRATEAAWRADIALLGNEHRLLREAVAAFPSRRLSERSGSGGVSPFDLIAGVAAHDLYHAGQVQLLKKQGRGS